MVICLFVSSTHIQKPILVRIIGTIYPPYLHIGDSGKNIQSMFFIQKEVFYNPVIQRTENGKYMLISNTYGLLGFDSQIFYKYIEFTTHIAVY